MKRELRHGFTTGACAAAAALGAARMLSEQRLVESVEISLPAGFSATFALCGQRISQDCAACFVVKDAGDDPDATNGVEVHAEVSLVDSGEEDKGVIITGGIGIGRVTKPGLAVPVGEWAINPVPTRMITKALQEVFPPSSSTPTPHVIISIPDGKERARRTLNERLGILGGLSILGTTGVVKPISHKAWTDTLEVALDVALAADSSVVVLSTGRTSEMAAQGFLELPKGKRQKDKGGSNLLPLALSPLPESYVMMGDHVAHALEACHRRGFVRIVLAAQFAKLVKIAAGHSCTHVGDSRLDLDALATWARESGLDEVFAKKIECANTAREAYESDEGGRLAAAVAPRALEEIKKRAPGASIAVLLVDYRGRPAATFGDWAQDNRGKQP
jgi:cobalt-precorrin-5B (C1)-methyltransferase